MTQVATSLLHHLKTSSSDNTDATEPKASNDERIDGMSRFETCAILETPSYFLSNTDTSRDRSNSSNSNSTATAKTHLALYHTQQEQRPLDKCTGSGDAMADSSKDEAATPPPPPPAALPSQTAGSFYPHHSQNSFSHMSEFSGHYMVGSMPSSNSTIGMQKKSADEDEHSPLEQQSSHQQAFYGSPTHLSLHQNQQAQLHASPYFSSTNVSAMFSSFSPQQEAQHQMQMQRPNTAVPSGADSLATHHVARNGMMANDPGLHDTLFSSVNQSRGTKRVGTAGGRSPGTGSELGIGGTQFTTGIGYSEDDVRDDPAADQKRPARRSSEEDLAQCQYTVTTEICLRARNGDRSADVWYPRAPNVMAVMSQLGEPYTNGTTALHFFAAAQHEREREHQLAGGSQSHQRFAFQPQQNQLPFHVAQSSMGDGDHQLSEASSRHTYDVSGITSFGTPLYKSAQNSHVSLLPGILCYHPPPLEDFSHPNPHLRPRTQEERLRYPSDLYTPRWIRDEGAKREGWCSLCEQGQWLQLKTSQYWYHVKGAHGVNYHTGQIYDPPVQLRVFHDTCGTTHGLCGQCGDWVKIVTPRRKRNFASWFRHAQKCQRSQLPAGLFGFAPTPSLTSSVPGTASGPVESDSGSRGVATSSGTAAGTFGHSLMAPPSTGSQSTNMATQSSINTDNRALAETCSGNFPRSARSWATSAFGTMPPVSWDSTAICNRSDGLYDGSAGISPTGGAALSLPPSPHSMAGRGLVMPATHRFVRTQPPSRGSASYKMNATSVSSLGLAAPQTYDELTASTGRHVRSAPHHMHAFHFGHHSNSQEFGGASGSGDDVDASGDLSSVAPPNTASSGGGGGGGGGLSSNAGASEYANPSSMSANQFIATSAGAAASAVVAAQSNTYSSLAETSQHTFPAASTSTQSAQRPHAPVAAAWLT